MATCIQTGQVPKCCELCETDTKIKWKCVKCNVLMCKKCKDNVHNKIRSSDKHKILDIKEVGLHSEELDFSNIYCQEHEGQTCVMFCKSCDQLVCTLCIAEVHNGHGFVQISEGYDIRIENVKEEQKRMKVLVDELTSKEKQITSLRKSEKSKYKQTRNTILAHNEALKKSLDMYTEKLITELDQIWETLRNALCQEGRRVSTIKARKKDLSTQANDIVKSKDADEVFRESKKIVKLVIESEEPIKLDFTTTPIFIPGEITEHKMGSLRDVRKDLVMKVVQQFTTDIGRVSYISTCPDNTLWISDQQVIKRVKPNKSKLKVMSNLNMKIWGLAVTPSNDLLLIIKRASRLTQVSGSSGQIIHSEYSVDQLLPTTVHVSSDYKVLVGAGGPSRKAIIRMNKEGKHEKTYEHNRNKQPIFNYVRHIATTTNGTIFAVDGLSDDWRGRVVVLGRDGDIINTYTGHPKINNVDKSFKPRRFVTTSLDNIIIPDADTNTLHILNSVGHLIMYYNTENIGILCPYSLSFTSSGQLYIGCTTTVGSKDKGKLYEVYISQI